MTEQKLEKIIIDAIGALELEGAEVIGAWQPGVIDGIKAAADAAARAVITVKVSPRSYEQFTSAEAQFDAAVELRVRADADARGLGFFQTAEAIARVIHGWQRSFAAYAETFAVADEFNPTGFRLDGGDCGLDRELCVWSFTQQFTLQGIVHYQ